MALMKSGGPIHLGGDGDVSNFEYGDYAVFGLMAVLSLSGMGIEQVTEVRAMMRLTDWLTLSCT